MDTRKPGSGVKPRPILSPKATDKLEAMEFDLLPRLIEAARAYFAGAGRGRNMARAEADRAELDNAKRLIIETAWSAAECA